MKHDSVAFSPLSNVFRQLVPSHAVKEMPDWLTLFVFRVPRNPKIAHLGTAYISNFGVACQPPADCHCVVKAHVCSFVGKQQPSTSVGHLDVTAETQQTVKPAELFDSADTVR